MKKLQLLGLLTLLTLPLIYQLTPLEILKLKVFDAWVKEQPTSDVFVTLDITEQDVQQEGGWPFPRQRLAEIHMDLLHRGAMGVGYVIAFSEPDRFGGDEQFANVLGLYPSVIAMFETDNQQYPQTTGTVILGDDIGGVMLKGSTQNIDILKEKAYQGISSAPIDVDGLTRRLPLLMRTPDGWTPALGIQILKVLAQADTYVIKTNDNGLEEIRVKGLPPVSVDSLGRKWISWVDTPSTTLQEMDVANKFVIVGVTANGVMPQLSTPAGLLEPHKVQAALAESILIQDSPYIPDYALSVELLILAISVVLIWTVLNVLGITLGVSSALVIMTATGIYGFWTAQQGILIDVTWSLIAEFITASTAFYLRFREQYKLRQQIKKQFEHYLDPRQVKQLQKNPSLLKLGGEKRYATFLFTDVRGFTSMSETLEPEEVTYIMNKALTAQQSAVQKHGGMVDKYIGDAMMAIFNAPLDLDKHENKAIDCALDIQKNMETLNLEMAEKNLPPVAIGIGINTGYAVIGNMGSEQRFDYTAIGDAVNTGARLESGTKEAGVDLLIGYNTAIKSDYKLKLLEPLTVKGKEKPLQVYTI
jgi:adenylate cyclase